MRYSAFVFIFTFSLSTSASDYLEPEDSIFSRPDSLWDYYQMVISRLEEAYAADVLARVVVLPSFAPEYVVGIRKTSDGYMVFQLSPEKQLWGYKVMDFMEAGSIKIMKDGEFVRDDEGIKDLEEEYPKHPDEVKISRCEKKIGPDLAKAILNVWEKMLLETRYIRSDDMGLDGVTYHFSMTTGFQILGGHVWSPSPKSKPGLLVEISDLMVDFCHGKRGAKQKLVEAVEGLSGGFQKQ